MEKIEKILQDIVLEKISKGDGIDNLEKAFNNGIKKFQKSTRLNDTKFIEKYIIKESKFKIVKEEFLKAIDKFEEDKYYKILPYVDSFYNLIENIENEINE